MSKLEMKNALIERIGEELSGTMYWDAITLLDQFEKLFELKKYAENASGLEKYWYYAVGYGFAPGGYAHDVWVNQTVGKYLFPEHYKFGTLTATLWRVKKDYKDHWLDDDLEDDPYNFKLAMQICAVLNNYDKGHC